MGGVRSSLLFATILVTISLFFSFQMYVAVVIVCLINT